MGDSDGLIRGCFEGVDVGEIWGCNDVVADGCIDGSAEGNASGWCEGL